jgi:hypothetical protein
VKAVVTNDKLAEFTVEDLPRFSPWPARLLGLTEWRPRRKTATEIEREYGHEKWGALLERSRSVAGETTLYDVEDWLLDGALPSLCSIGDGLELLPLRDALNRHYDTVTRALGDFLPVASVTELGAGCGSAILRLAADSRFRGVALQAAEYTRSGIELMGQLARAAKVELRIGHCDLSVNQLENLSVPEGSVVFTCMAACYVPRLDSSFVAWLCSLKPKVVFHFEPCYEHCDADSLTGALRSRYIQLNDYNRNLVTLLHQHERAGAIRIVRELPAVIGVNPLLPISILAWTPAARFS